MNFFKPKLQYFAIGALGCSVLLGAGYVTATKAISSQAQDRLSSPQQSLSALSRQDSAGLCLNSGRLGHMLDQLELDPAQLEQIQAIRQAARSRTQPLKAQVRIAQSEMRTLMASDTAVETLRQKHMALAALEQQLQAERFETMLQIRAVLSPQQRSELNTLMQVHLDQRHHSGLGSQGLRPRLSHWR